MAIQFKDNRLEVKKALHDKGVTFLDEAKASLVSQTQRNTPVKSGDLKRSFGNDSYVDETNLIAYIGSTLQYAIWVELGTGEYAVNGDGRKGGWLYKDDDGKLHFTRGMKPKRMLYRAYQVKKKSIQEQANRIYRELNG